MSSKIQTCSVFMLFVGFVFFFSLLSVHSHPASSLILFTFLSLCSVILLMCLALCIWYANFMVHFIVTLCLWQLNEKFMRLSGGFVCCVFYFCYAYLFQTRSVVCSESCTLTDDFWCIKNAHVNT